ncbi:MAG TPA: sulfotransferase [Solirubrobacteraceae bacterium]|nr:sulfotransferase [Solirubrobacteraceae bacterium]
MGAHIRPSFFVVGANKCGTSSLYRYLLTHPAVLPCAEKEPNFFGEHSPDHIARHIDDYLALFPTVEHRGPVAVDWHATEVAGDPDLVTVVIDREPDLQYVTGEATASTFHDVAPELLHEHLPDLDLVVMVRDPVERAFSHHRMYRRFQRDGWDPGFSIGRFEDDIRAELAAYERGERTEYVGPGVYDELLDRWSAIYGEDRLLVLLTEDLRDPARAPDVMQRLEEHLGLVAHDYGEILERRFNSAPPSAIPPAERELLAAFYRPHNDRLRERLGRDIGWT